MKHEDRAYATAAEKSVGPLEQIQHRILSAATAAREIGNKLNEHADAVHGVLPETPQTEMRDEKIEMSPTALLDRIFVALDALDRAQSYMAIAAGRNSTLA